MTYLFPGLNIAVEKKLLILSIDTNNILQDSDKVISIQINNLQYDS